MVTIHQNLGFNNRYETDKFDCKYGLFTGQETREIRLDTGEIIDLEFEGDVESGKITLQMEDPNGQIIWKTENIVQYKGCRTIPVYLTGRYSLVAIGRNTNGYFHIEWNIES